jgi:hypothetical protein
MFGGSDSFLWAGTTLVILSALVASELQSLMVCLSRVLNRSRCSSDQRV